MTADAEQIANLNEIVLVQANQIAMLTRVVWLTFGMADRADIGPHLTWEEMFLEAAHYLLKDPATDRRAKLFLEALGRDAPLKTLPPIPRPDLHVVR